MQAIRFSNITERSTLSSCIAAAADVTRGAGAAVQEVAALAADISLKSPHLRPRSTRSFCIRASLRRPDFPSSAWSIWTTCGRCSTCARTSSRAVKIDTQITGKVPALGNRVVTFSVYYISPKGEYATWRATRQSSGYDIKTFEVRARPAEKVDGLRPGMSVLVDRS